MCELILVKYGEIILKGQNRCQFEDSLIRNIKKALYDSKMLLKSRRQFMLSRSMRMLILKK